MWYLWCHVLQLWLWPSEISLIQKLWGLSNRVPGMQEPIHSLLNSKWGGGAECEAFRFHTAQGTAEAATTLKDPLAPKTSILRTKSKKSAWKSEIHGQALAPSCNITCQRLLIWSQAAKGCTQLVNYWVPLQRYKARNKIIAGVRKRHGFALGWGGTVGQAPAPGHF